MRSIYDDIIETLKEHTFSIPGTHPRTPYDETSPSYPMLVVHEISNLPRSHGTVRGETTTTASYQIDVLTRNCVDAEGVPINRWQAGRRLIEEVTNLLEEKYKLTRRSITERQLLDDVLMISWRGECLLDPFGYSYRP